MRSLRILGVIALVCAAFLPYQAQAADLSQLGTITVSRTHGNGMVVWDATQVLTGLIGQHATRADVLAQLESDASMILVDKMQTYKKTAKTMSVVVLYAKTGAISPAYKVATFEGVERLLTMKASTAAALPKDTPDQVRAGKVPAGITVQLTGQLPPDLQ